MIEVMARSAPFDPTALLFLALSLPACAQNAPAPVAGQTETMVVLGSATPVPLAESPRSVEILPLKEQSLAAESPQAAARIQGRLRAVADLLLQYPLIGTTTDDPTIRRVMATPYPYLVFYEVAGDDIIIHAVRHGARRPPEREK